MCFFCPGHLPLQPSVQDIGRITAIFKMSAKWESWEIARGYLFWRSNKKELIVFLRSLLWPSCLAGYHGHMKLGQKDYRTVYRRMRVFSFDSAMSAQAMCYNFVGKFKTFGLIHLTNMCFYDFFAFNLGLYRRRKKILWDSMTDL